MIRVHLDALLVSRGMSLTELAETVGITLANLSNLKTGKARAIRFTTLEAICAALDCQPGDLMSHTEPSRRDEHLCLGSMLRRAESRLGLPFSRRIDTAALRIHRTRPGEMCRTSLRSGHLLCVFNAAVQMSSDTRPAYPVDFALSTFGRAGEENRLR